MKVFINKDLILDEESVSVMAALNALYTKKQNILATSVKIIGYTLTGRLLDSTNSKDRTILEGVRNGIEILEKVNVIKVIEKNSEFYILSDRNLNVDVDEDFFTIVDLSEIQKIFQTATRPFNLFYFFVKLVGTLGGKSKVWSTTQKEMAKEWHYGFETLHSYFDQLENMKLIYVHHSNVVKATYPHNRLKNFYGRYEDKESVVAEATKYISTENTIECRDDNINRRAIKQRYNAYVKGSKKYFNNNKKIMDLYRECVEYNKSVDEVEIQRDKKISQTLEENINMDSNLDSHTCNNKKTIKYRELIKLDLSVFPNEIVSTIAL